jgi:hypothetical protein
VIFAKVELLPRKDPGSLSYCRRAEFESREGGVLVVEIFLNVARYLIIFKGSGGRRSRLVPDVSKSATFLMQRLNFLAKMEVETLTKMIYFDKPSPLLAIHHP